MATQVITLQAQNTVRINVNQPDWRDGTLSEIMVDGTEESYIHGSPPGYNEYYMLTNFEPINTNTHKGKEIVNAEAYIHAKVRSGMVNGRVSALGKPFDAKKVSYHNRPNKRREGFEYTGKITSTYAYHDAFFADMDAHGAIFNGILASGGNAAGSDEDRIEIWIHGANTTSKPYLKVTLRDAQFRIGDQTPASGFIDRKKTNLFSWRPYFRLTDMVIGDVTAQKGVFRWRAIGETNYKEITTSPTGVAIPANTFPRGTIEWQVFVQSNFGINGIVSPWCKLTTIDSIPTTFARSPKNSYVDSTRDQIFYWEHVIDTGSEQAKFDLQLQSADGTWTTHASASTSEQQLLIPAGTLTGDITAWRVRTYNTDNVAAAWSDPAAIMVIAAPDVPELAGVTDTPRPEVSWQSRDQQAWQVKAGDAYLSPPAIGTDKKHKIPVFLPDGTYEIGVRVQNQYGLWSQWAAMPIVIANTPGPEIRLTARADGQKIRLTWLTDGTYPEYRIMRDGAEIGTATGRDYIDHLSNGKHVYQVRGVMAGDAYAMSAPVTEILRPQFGLIAEVGVWDWLPLKLRRGNPPQQEITFGSDVTYIHYSGRALPVAEIGEHRSRTHRFAHSFRSREEADKLLALEAKLVAYKNNKGAMVVGVLDSLSLSQDWASIDIGFNITEVDYHA